jgi:hypothetical protein
VQTGITGGFAPPTPSAILIVTGTPNKSDLQVTASYRPDGEPTLQDALPKSLAKTEPGVDEMIAELYTILKSIPTGGSSQNSDYYRLDTSIAFMSDDLMWQNGAPQGCSGWGEEKASQVETAKFQRAIQIVENLVAQAK